MNSRKMVSDGKQQYAKVADFWERHISNKSGNVHIVLQKLDPKTIQVAGRTTFPHLLCINPDAFGC